MLPVTITAGAAPIALAAHATWLVCRDICIPQQGNFSLTLQNGSPSLSPQATLIQSALAKVPATAPFQATISLRGELVLAGSSLLDGTTSAEFIPSGDGIVETLGTQRVHRSGGLVSLKLGFQSSVDLRSGLAGIVKLAGANGVIRSFDVSAAPALPTPVPSTASETSLALLLLGALAGGLVLNLMPCVFPILAMKAMALSRMSGADRRSIRAEGASYTVGVVAAFLALGAVLIALRGAGATVGWGFQLQSSVFVTLVAWLLFATALNMSNVFSMAGWFAGAGQSLAKQPGHVGSFFTGLLAVVVATPCTAAFMGVAVAGALAAPALVGLSIFAVMGLGLALPYTLIAVFPGVARVLPRPGRWMEIVRQALAFPLYASVAWLVWVVSQQSSSSGVLTASAGLVGIGFAGWALGTGQAGSPRGRRFGSAIASAAVVCSISLLLVGPVARSAPSETFSAARLAELRSQGRPVFVNMTAAWCITCLVNERLALSPQPVRKAFAQAHVAYLKGDWTKQDPAISAFLQAQGRDGVPLYLFYPPGRPVVVLPQLLSESTLLDQVAKLRSGQPSGA